MTKFARAALGLASCLSLSLAALPAHADTIAQWTFETSVPAIAGPLSAEVGSGSALGYHAGSSTYSSPTGNGSAHSFSSNVWAVGDYYQFGVSTLGMDSIVVSWDQASSNTGPRDFTLAYSTNGTSFTDFASYSVLANASPNATWNSSGAPKSIYSFAYDLSGVSALNNQGTVYFRLVDASTTPAGSTYTAVQTGGTDRVDNFTVSGVAAVPEPETYALMLAGLGLVGGIARRNVRRAA
jgi:hypothetical protein